MPTRKQINKGFYGFEDDSAEFLKPSNTDPYKASASGVGYNATKDDDRGYERGLGAYADDDLAFRKPSWTGDVDNVNANHGYLIDNDPSLPSGKLLAGGGALSQKGGIGAGPPRHAPKNVGHAGQNEHAQFDDGSVSVEAGLMMMLDRMRTGKLKVFKEHNEWWEEFRLYHRKDGKVVKEGDDLLCATRYGLMMLRYANTQSMADRWRRPIEYPDQRYA
jgi:hypothetical protein